MVRVLQRKPGAALTLFNGRGGEYNAELITAAKIKPLLKFNNFYLSKKESPLAIHLGQSHFVR
jgi:16S rRNA (uracil1498-N3)-methyltransferase